MKKAKVVVVVALLLLFSVHVSAQIVPESERERGSGRGGATLDSALGLYSRGDYEAAASELFRVAPQGNPEAQYYLGYMMQNGLGTSKDPFGAVSWFRKAAGQDHLPSMTLLGQAYSTGRGVTRNDKEAVKWYTRAAQMGDAAAQNALGTMVRDGRGYKKNDALAIQWFAQAAGQGYAAAQSNLGAMYYLGRGVKANPAEAIKWYTAAAQQRDLRALSALGAIYRTGDGAEKNPVVALQYYKAAADADYLPAMVALGEMFEHGEGDATKGPPDAALWYARAAKKGSAIAQTRLGAFYETGVGLPQDVKAAQEWYAKAADGKRPHLPAIMALAKLYQSGKLGAPDYREAFNYYLRCAEAGEPVCERETGLLYRDGKGIAKNLVQAYAWLARAAETFPESEMKADTVVQRINVSNMLTEEQQAQARNMALNWRPRPLTP